MSQEEEELKQAIALIKAGKKSEAVPILKSILKTDRNNELAWLWVSTCADKTEDKIFCFQEALRINPNNDNAKKALKQLEPNPNPEQYHSSVSKDTLQPEIIIEPKSKTESVINKKILNSGLILLIIICILGFFVGMWMLVTWQQKESSSPIETLVSKPDVNYALINLEKGSSTKCTLDIRLPNRISEDEIKHIAEYISKNEGAGCSPLFIFYFLPDEKPGIDTAWAYSHFNPQLEVNINGLDLETEATLEATTQKADENVIGNWLDTRGLPHTIVIKKLNGTYQMTTVFGDGSGETKTLSVKAVNGEERLYENPDNAYGDYMVIEKNGDLAFYDDQGFIYKLQPK